MNPGHLRGRHAPLACCHLLKGNWRDAPEATRAGTPTARRGGVHAGRRTAARMGMSTADRAMERLCATFSDALARRDEIVQSSRLPPGIAELIFGTRGLTPTARD